MKILKLNLFFFNLYCSVTIMILIKKFFNDKLQEIDSPYFSLENFAAISEKLNRNNFSMLHLNIRSLNKNIDDFREFLASFKGSFSVIVLTES